MYEDYLLKELIPYIESHYSVKSDRDDRFVGGLSMGGFVALDLAFSHPDLFSKVGGLSAAVWKNKEEIEKILPELSWIAEENTRLLANAQTQNLAGISVYLNHGNMDHDWLIQGNSTLADLLKAKGMKIEYSIEKGGHDTSFWSSQAEDFLLFFAEN